MHLSLSPKRLNTCKRKFTQDSPGVKNLFTSYPAVLCPMHSTNLVHNIPIFYLGSQGPFHFQCKFIFHTSRLYTTHKIRIQGRLTKAQYCSQTSLFLLLYHYNTTKYWKQFAAWINWRTHLAPFVLLLISPSKSNRIQWCTTFIFSSHPFEIFFCTI